GNESPIDVTLPVLTDEVEYVSLWSSSDEAPSDDSPRFAPGDVVPFVGTSMRLFRVDAQD
ncbi:hypothetical protein ABTD49_19870, partial [Acinetobacter baumannii]